MPLPRAPKGEKPAITIKWQRRQIIQMENTISELRADLADLGCKLIDKEAYVEQLNNELFAAKEAAEKQREAFREERQLILEDRQRLAFLEGYYERSKECTIPTEANVSPPSLANTAMDHFQKQFSAPRSTP